MEMENLKRNVWEIENDYSNKRIILFGIEFKKWEDTLKKRKTKVNGGIGSYSLHISCTFINIFIKLIIHMIKIQFRNFLTKIIIL